MSRAYVHNIAFPISQLGTCLAGCIVSNPAPRNRQESQEVTMLFTQLLVNTGSLKVEHQHTLISHSHSNNLRETSHTHTHTHTHTEQSVGNNKPKSQSLSLQVWGRAWWARESSVSCKEGPQEPGGQQGRQSPPSSRAEPLVADAALSVVWNSTPVCGVRLTQQWSETCLSYALKVVFSTLLGLFGKCLGTPDARCGIYAGANGWYMAVLLDTPAGKCGISPGA